MNIYAPVDCRPSAQQVSWITDISPTNKSHSTCKKSFTQIHPFSQKSIKSFNETHVCDLHPYVMKALRSN